MFKTKVRIIRPYLFVFLCSLVTACGKGGKAEIQCGVHGDCSLETGGLCNVYAPTERKWCSYPDATCSGTELRWSDFETGDGLSGECVVPLPVDADAGVDAAMADASPNPDGSLSDGAPDATVPVTVTQVALGFSHTCALLSDGTVKCWGLGSSGQLGYGNANTIGDNELPSSVGSVDVGASVVQIAAGDNHTCARLEGGAVRCWGANSNGQLGYGHELSIGDNESPASQGDVSIGGVAIQIAAGGNHTCVVLDGGSVRCWGAGSGGMLGYGNGINDVGDNELPSTVGLVNVGGPVKQITAGNSHTCAVLTTGFVRCWGQGALGRLGYGNTNSIGASEDPSSAGSLDLGAGPTRQVKAGFFHTCAVKESGTVYCWGCPTAGGNLGYGTVQCLGSTPSTVPGANGAITLGVSAVDLGSMSGDHACVRVADDKLRCWGPNDAGQLGYPGLGAIGDTEHPSSAGNVNVGADVLGVATGWKHSCAWLTTGGVRCWGEGDDGKLGYGNTTAIGDNEAPASISEVPLFN